MAGRVIDITGPIREGMWNYEPPFPRFGMKPLDPVPWVDRPVFCETFTGLHSQTGTYLETPAHFYGNHVAPLVDDLPVERLYRIDCTVLHLERLGVDFRTPRGRVAVTADLLARADVGIGSIPAGTAILVSTGWGRYWMDDDYLDGSPFFAKDAMEWLLERAPFLLGTDFPRWEDLSAPQGIFPEFYASGCLMLAPCTGLETLVASRVELTVLPLRIPGTSCTPCRAIVAEPESGTG